METIGTAIKLVVDMVLEILRDAGKDVTDLRGARVSVSISFGGAEGEAVSAQREIEADWNADDELDAEF